MRKLRNNDKSKRHDAKPPQTLPSPSGHHHHYCDEIRAEASLIQVFVTRRDNSEVKNMNKTRQNCDGTDVGARRHVIHREL